MRIYLVGAHSTGKTTLLNYVRESYNINTISEVARDVINKYGGSLRKIYNDIYVAEMFQMDIIEEQMRREKETEPPFICDRSLDILAYFANYTKCTENVLKNEYVQRYIETFKDPDVVVMLIYPKMELLEGDGIRVDLDTEDIFIIHGMIKYILESNNIKYMLLNTKNQNERARFLDTILTLGDIR